MSGGCWGRMTPRPGPGVGSVAVRARRLLPPPAHALAASRWRSGEESFSPEWCCRQNARCSRGESCVRGAVCAEGGNAVCATAWLPEAARVRHGTANRWTVGTRYGIRWLSNEGRKRSVPVTRKILPDSRPGGPGRRGAGRQGFHRSDVLSRPTNDPTGSTPGGRRAPIANPLHRRQARRGRGSAAKSGEERDGGVLSGDSPNVTAWWRQ